MLDKIPKKLGKYDIKRILGQGAMGVVYEGFDPIIERRVAIKTIKTDLLDSAERNEILVRFKREAQAAGKINDANIITIYDYGVDDTSDIAFIVMEFVQGKELKQLFDENVFLTIPRVVMLMTTLLRALGKAHSQGVIHRDLKPANILLVDGELDNVKIMDFGIARLESSTMTQTGTVIGTPNYMSPEQFMGLEVDKRSDLFSMGVILYQLLTGERPFSGASTQTTMFKVLKENPLAPSEINIQCPRSFDAVINKALAKKPENRYQTTRDFSDALQQAAASSQDDDGTTIMLKKPSVVIADVAKESDSRKPGIMPVKKFHTALIFSGIIIISLFSGAAWLFIAGDGKQPQKVSTPVAKQPEVARGWIKFDIIPSGAVIRFVNGEELGTSPITVALPVGEYDLVITKEGYEKLVTNIAVSTGIESIFEQELLAK